MKTTMFEADREMVVHLKNCGSEGPGAAPYFTTATTPDEMVALLARPEIANGHSAPSRMRACGACILPLVGA